MSTNGEVSDTLIDSEFSYKPANDATPGTWSQVAGTKSWHTGTATASSTHSGFDPNRYGRPGARSVSGSVHSFNSSVAERSQYSSHQGERTNGFAKIKAYVSTFQRLCLQLCRLQLHMAADKANSGRRRKRRTLSTRRRRRSHPQTRMVKTVTVKIP